MLAAVRNVALFAAVGAATEAAPERAKAAVEGGHDGSAAQHGLREARGLLHGGLDLQEGKLAWGRGNPYAGTRYRPTEFP
jgi:hypothetical protein